MRVIKRLYLFVLKSFLPLFAMTFFIVLFIVLMQFLWKYVNDLVGKGLSVDVLAELFFYAAVSMVPMALPLAILLASLMTFGNFGEKFELTAMKASGISLVQVMKPLIVLVTCVAIGAFFFQNDVLPKAQVKMWTLLFSMRQKSPELEIPEGVFYDQIPGYNLYVGEKNRDTGVLYNAMIYANESSASGSTILLADSAVMATTPDFRYLYLHLYNGEQFENLREQSMGDRNVPYRRESFLDKEILIPFDANFNRIDEGGLRKQYVGKNITELNQTIDSIGVRIDSMGREYGAGLKSAGLPLVSGASGSTVISPAAVSMPETAAETSLPARREVHVSPLDIDSLISAMTPSQCEQTFTTARSIVESRRGEMEFKAAEMAEEYKLVRRHQIELLKKFTLSVACLIFFFIGAPLGAIIRKGGLGTPLVISVLLFLVYYIIDNTGYKMARDGHAPVWFGMWLSTFILAPLSVYVTYKAMRDSSVFDKDRYMMLLRKCLGLRSPRAVPYKEVVINEMDSARGVMMLRGLDADLSEVLMGVDGIPPVFPKKISFRQYWLHGLDCARVVEIGTRINNTIDYLCDSHDLKMIDVLSSYPEISLRWIYHPARRRWLSYTMMALAPVSFPLWLVSLRYLKGLRADLSKSRKVTARLIDHLEANA